ncbi:Maf family protein [Cellulomonas marina]|uniref:Nucleoside triphosphate pyrophosphatase n=1 Tax=Cellulomonas marina TaxID=988821 RepID=A0A1I0ZKC7_9CELL|nr:nucleoside triphosphate pyrophosphatase [Cellulomonas marina]GIG28656.1 Maf-like protein [Cellulomonas marina]SFB25927.1 septum formation protein [Cellulomonas marina]
MTRLLLASASPARRATLVAAGIDPLVVVSAVDEDAALAAGRERFGPLDPADAVLLLAQAKAQAVAARLTEDDAELPGLGHDEDPEDLLVLGCDSMLELDGEILGKPADAAEAVRRWEAMRGRSGTLHTGHWLVDVRPAPVDGGSGTGAALGATASTVVHFADVSDEEVAAYVATDEPLAVAGAFTVDGLGGPFVEGVEGDHHAVVGLSLPLLRGLLADVGVPLPSLWRPGTRRR